MPNTQETHARKPLRLWPGVTAAVLLVLFRSVLPALAPDAGILDMDMALIGTLGGLIFSLVILVWWFFFSRVSWTDRLISLVVIAVAMVVTRPLTDISIQNGFMNRMFYFSVPMTISLALVLWAIASRNVSAVVRFGRLHEPTASSAVHRCFIGGGLRRLSRYFWHKVKTRPSPFRLLRLLSLRRRLQVRPHRYRRQFPLRLQLELRLAQQRPSLVLRRQSLP